MKRLNKNNLNIKLAIPNKGRLMEPSLQLVRDMGLSFDTLERRLFSPCLNFNLDMLYLRAGDIPRYVESGIVDFGITGSDLVEEDEVKVNKVLYLNFGHCDLILAKPEHSIIKSKTDLSGKKVATSFPNLTAKFLKQNKIKAKIIEIEGAAEITPWLGVADVIVDLVSSGESLRVHSLNPIENIFQSEAVLIANDKLDKEKSEKIKRFVDIMEGTLNGRKKKYLMMNAPENSLEKIKKVIPGLKSPTVLKLAKPGMIAIHSVVDEDIIWEIIPKLKKIGASGILVTSIEN